MSVFENGVLTVLWTSVLLITILVLPLRSRDSVLVSALPATCEMVPNTALIVPGKGMYIGAHPCKELNTVTVAI